MTGILELAIVVFIAAVLGIIARLLNQPILLAYLVTGALIAGFDVFHFESGETLQTFSDLGITFLLFLVGLEMNYEAVRLVGRQSLVIGIGQILFTSGIGYVLSSALGFSPLYALYIAIALSFSSTVVVIQFLSDKKDLNSLYGKLSIGMLLVQDVVAIVILVLLASIETDGVPSALPIIFTFVKAFLLFGGTLWLGRSLMPRLFDTIGRSRELLFISSLAWVFMVAAFVENIGFSIEIGGFLAGLSLANSSENFQIANRVKPLRDFFILIFFVLLGSSVTLSSFSGLFLPIAILSLFVLIGNPLIVFVLMGLMGYRKRTTFLTGVAIAQISEFSLILAALGLRIGHLDETIVSMITAVGVVTILISSYMITHADTLYRLLSKPLSIFERAKTIEDGSRGKKFDRPYILVGFGRTGQSVAYNLPKKELLVVDFDPEVIEKLKRNRFQYVLGDIADPEVSERINLSEARLVISTAQDLESNFTLLEYVHELQPRGQEEKPMDLNRSFRRVRVVVSANDEYDAALLYEKEADYVLLPHFVAGEYFGKMVSYDPDVTFLTQLKSRDLDLIIKEEKTLI
ncbi:MAG: sodium:proton exchanger [Candidatus Harrisonbacteria bacterium CG10_big_fil_rev_8_21_14_0_10_42_17]|uniref:Sodium:proton exchanger n=1 Tax=Candidatus Harrisonbacteria bacterium CG10_big_fil_rev_8_21_14_0_10_42_17 TaxID=1974584 RepID=A0A2M6WHE3_9BACT|nr:MAG: sodium:proton exchanger [Candidatus Harrisonbacteria bacterium CG10_big_fil_rev_8_21_14_0_10_42_17]